MSKKQPGSQHTFRTVSDSQVQPEDCRINRSRTRVLNPTDHQKLDFSRLLISTLVVKTGPVIPTPLHNTLYIVLQPQVCRNHRSAHKSVEFTTPVLPFQYSIIIIIQIRNKMKSVFQTYSPCFNCKLPYQIVPGHRQRYVYNSKAPSSAAKCECEPPYHGDACERIRCADDCSSHGYASTHPPYPPLLLPSRPALSSGPLNLPAHPALSLQCVQLLDPKCKCHRGWWGTSCENLACPMTARATANAAQMSSARQYGRENHVRMQHAPRSSYHLLLRGTSVRRSYEVMRNASIDGSFQIVSIVYQPAGLEHSSTSPANTLTCRLF